MRAGRWMGGVWRRGRAEGRGAALWARRGRGGGLGGSACERDRGAQAQG